MVARSLHLLGCVALAEGRYAEAQELAHESVAKYRPTGDHNIGFSIALAGYAALALGQLSTARDFVNEALQRALTAGDVFLLFWTLPATALLLAERGELEWAVEVYALVSRHPFAAKSRWFEDVVGRRMVAVAASLPPDVAAQAQKRGQARDVQRTAAELLEALREPGLADEGRRT